MTLWTLAVSLVLIFCCHICVSPLKSFHFHSVHTKHDCSRNPCYDLLQKHELTQLLKCHWAPLSVALKLYVYFFPMCREMRIKLWYFVTYFCFVCVFLIISYYVSLQLFYFISVMFLFVILYVCGGLGGGSNISVAGWDVFALLCLVGRELNSRSRSSM